jgi:hypothetical protein
MKLPRAFDCLATAAPRRFAAAAFFPVPRPPARCCPGFCVLPPPPPVLNVICNVPRGTNGDVGDSDSEGAFFVGVFFVGVFAPPNFFPLATTTLTFFPTFCPPLGPGVFFPPGRDSCAFFAFAFASVCAFSLMPRFFARTAARLSDDFAATALIFAFFGAFFAGVVAPFFGAFFGAFFGTFFGAFLGCGERGERSGGEVGGGRRQGIVRSNA